MSKEKIEKLISITINPFSIFSLVSGTFLGVLNQYPNFILMFIQGFVEGIAFYILAIIISGVCYTPTQGDQ